ncbi:MAG: glycoside hydrolase family 3 C-terminal domain-containing protein [Clostridiaceae bacterium]|nr:glycoside hydrolase family 3 C-terminal domain-containing protein [Clostridiaceae bacterium]
MNFNDAVKKYNQNPTDENLYSVARELCSQLKTAEKLHMLSGKRFFLRNGVDLITKGQKYNCRPCIAGGVKRLGIPEVAFSDGPRGVVMGNSTCFPVSMLRGASFDDELEYEIGSAIADEVAAQGGNYFAGICINLLRNPRWGRAQETYGEDPYLLGRMGAALTRAVQDKGIIACPKHYAVNSIENIRFDVNVLCDDKTLHEVYLPHFKACIDAGAMSIMGAYNLFRGEHCCESKYLLKDELRDEWGFTGFTISDFLMGVRNAPKALKAGLDIEMPQIMHYATLPLDLKTGKVSMDDIDASVQSILRGLIKITPKLKDTPKSVVACKKHTQLAKKAALEGTVLLKNDGVLPLAQGSKVGIIGRYANKINVGDHGSSSVFAPYTVTPYEGLCNLYGKENVVLFEGTAFSPGIPKLKACDAVVVCVGSDYKQEGENLANFSKSDKTTQKAMGGDRYSLRIPEDEVRLIHSACRVFDKVIVNIIGGSAYIIEEWKDGANAILHSFYSGMEGGNALAELISGKVNPSGHLPFTMAKDENDYPDFLFPSAKTRDITYGYYHGYTLLDKEQKKAAYPFGFGLSYTEFRYTKIKAKDTGDSVEISLNVANKGGRDGKTVVQVYAGAEGEHTVKLLKGFKKVFVKAGENESVKIAIDKNNLKFYNPENKEWYLEDKYTFFVGQNSEDVTEVKL